MGQGVGALLASWRSPRGSAVIGIDLVASRLERSRQSGLHEVVDASVRTRWRRCCA
jgi:hypothetical protein